MSDGHMKSQHVDMKKKYPHMTRKQRRQLISNGAVECSDLKINNETSDKERRWYMCDSKKQYTEYDIGQKRKALGRRGVNIRSYLCPYCGLHHLTKKGNPK